MQEIQHIETLTYVPSKTHPSPKNSETAPAEKRTSTESDTSSKRPKLDNEQRARGQRMFGTFTSPLLLTLLGMLLGTLNKNAQKHSLKTPSEQKRLDIEQKLRQKLSLERQALSKTLEAEAEAKKIRIALIKREEALKKCAAIVKEWEIQAVALSHYMKTECSPVVYWMPRKHNPKTLEAFEKRLVEKVEQSKIDALYAQIGGFETQSEREARESRAKKGNRVEERESVIDDVSKDVTMQDAVPLMNATIHKIIEVSETTEQKLNVSSPTDTPPLETISPKIDQIMVDTKDLKDVPAISHPIIEDSNIISSGFITNEKDASTQDQTVTETETVQFTNETKSTCMELEIKGTLSEKLSSETIKPIEPSEIIEVTLSETIETSTSLKHTTNPTDDSITDPEPMKGKEVHQKTKEEKEAHHETKETLKEKEAHHETQEEKESDMRSETLLNSPNEKMLVDMKVLTSQFSTDTLASFSVSE